MRKRYGIGAAVVILAVAVFTAAHGGGAAATAAFSIVANQGDANSGYNFNGASKGHLVITVPVGAAVQLTFTNKGDLPHSLQVIPYATTPPVQALAQPVFPGAESPKPLVGTLKGKKAVVKFTASKPGRYLLICGFPGHALLGMYGIFDVSASAATKPTLVTK